MLTYSKSLSYTHLHPWPRSSDPHNLWLTTYQRGNYFYFYFSPLFHLYCQLSKTVLQPNCAICLCIYFYASTICFDYYKFLHYLKSESMPPVLLFSEVCCYLGSSEIPYEFQDCLFYLCEKCHYSFDRKCIESIDGFGQ